MKNKMQLSMNYKEKEKNERMMKNKQKMNSTNRYKVLKKKQKKLIYIKLIL